MLAPSTDIPIASVVVLLVENMLASDTSADPLLGLLCCVYLRLISRAVADGCVRASVSVRQAAREHAVDNLE